MRLALIALILAASPALAQDRQPLPRWEAAPDAASAAIARLGASTLLSSSAVALPEGGAALITFWDIPGLGRYRCIDILNPEMEQPGEGTCTRPIRHPH